MHKHGKWSIIVHYDPTNDANESTNDEFYFQLSALLLRILPHYIIILLGDSNATVSDPAGIQRGEICEVIPDHVYENGAGLLQLCAANSLANHKHILSREEDVRTHLVQQRREDQEEDRLRHCKSEIEIMYHRAYRRVKLGNTNHRLIGASLRLRIRKYESDVRVPRFKLRSFSNAGSYLKVIEQYVSILQVERVGK